MAVVVAAVSVVPHVVAARARVCVCVLAARDRATHSSDCARPTARSVEAVVVAACVAVARARVCVCVRACVCMRHA